MVLDAHGVGGVSRFAERAGAVTMLAEAYGEHTIADILTGLTESLVRSHGGDPRSFMYEQLDRLPGAMRALH